MSEVVVQVELSSDKVLSEKRSDITIAQKELESKKSLQPLRLFIIDDHFATWQVLREYFSQQGCIVEIFSDATLALNKLKQQQRSTPCDLVLTDVVMPKFDGL